MFIFNLKVNSKEIYLAFDITEDPFNDYFLRQIKYGPMEGYMCINSKTFSTDNPGCSPKIQVVHSIIQIFRINAHIHVAFHRRTWDVFCNSNIRMLFVPFTSDLLFQLQNLKQIGNQNRITLCLVMLSTFKCVILVKVEQQCVIWMNSQYYCILW